MAFCLGAFASTGKAQNIDTLSWIWHREGGTTVHDEVEFCVFVTPNQSFTVDWGDGNTEVFVPNTEVYFVWHLYAVSGIYTVTVTGSPTCNFTRLFITNAAPINNGGHDMSVYYLSMKCKYCRHVNCRGSDVGMGRGRISAIDIDPANNPSMTGLELQDNRMRLPECYEAHIATHYSAFTLAQYLEPRTVTRGEIVDFSDDATFIDDFDGTAVPTDFIVLVKGGCPPVPSPPHGHYSRDYCLPADPESYSETNGVLRFYRPGEYMIKMMNELIWSATAFGGMASAEVFQEIFLFPNNDACLASLTVSEGVLMPAFACDTLHYTAEVAHSIASVIITAIPSDTFATVTGDVGEQKLQVGANTFTITVTAEDAVTTKTYTVEVIRAVASSDACLTNLTVSEGVLEPVFECETLDYTVNKLPYSVSSVTITAVSRDPEASITGDVGEQKLQVGVNTFTITVTAEDAVTTKTYTVEVIRVDANAGTEACLATLTVESVISENVLRKETVHPAVECRILKYTVGVENSVSSVIITATPSDLNARSVTGTGRKELKVGENTFPVSITSEKGNVQRTYKVVIYRANESEKGLLIYPNPADGLLNIDNYTPSMGDIGIHDATGKLIQQIIPKNENSNEKEKIVINISHLASGVYFVKVDGETVRFVKE
jgi:hypothetical protein